MGRIYQRKQRDGSVGGPWWLDYYTKDGRRIRESAETTDKKKARDLLKDKEGKVVRGEPIITGRATYEEVRDALIAHYKSTGERDVPEVLPRLAHLDRHFTGWKADAITSKVIADYIVKRQGEETVSPVQKIRKRPSNGTINRELGVLGRMLRLAVEHGRLVRVPIIHKPQEAAPRSGFLEPAQYAAIEARLPEDLQVATALAYDLAWRTQEVLTLELRQVDLDAACIRLDVGSTKTGAGRVVYVRPALVERLQRHVERVKALARERGQVARALFPHFPQPYVAKRLVGTPRRDFRKAWASAAVAAGYPGALRHDMRRSGVRNMVNAGVPERVAMQVSGHKTRAVFDRYHIVSPEDLKSAAAKLDASRTAVGTTAGTTGPVVALARKRRVSATRA